MDDVQSRLTEVFQTCLQMEWSPEELLALNRASCSKWDSMAHLNLLLATEGVFEISIHEERGAAVRSFQDMVDLVRELCP